MKVCLPTLLLAIGLFACTGGGAPAGPCKDLCRELVQGCDYAAYPSFESCEEGCAYDEARGADIPGQLACIEAAECDTFATIECEHEHGGSDE